MLPIPAIKKGPGGDPGPDNKVGWSYTPPSTADLVLFIPLRQAVLIISILIVRAFSSFFDRDVVKSGARLPGGADKYGSVLTLWNFKERGVTDGIGYAIFPPAEKKGRKEIFTALRGVGQENGRG
jgi:hypothetical protein